MSQPSNPIKPSPNISLHSRKTLFKLHPTLPCRPKLRVLSCQNQKQKQNQNQKQNQHQNPLLSILLAVPEWADRVQERGMRQNRSLYTHQDWMQHRSSLRHARHFLSSLSSRVILSLIPPVITFTSFAALIAAYNMLVSMDWLPEFFPLLRASSLPYQLTAPALALLLVFRTEASYSRFEEGRKAWTKLISATNGFASQVIATCADAPLRNALLHYVMAFPVALKCHVIYGSNFQLDLKPLLEEDDLTLVLNSKHRPRCIIQFISQTIQMLNLDDSKRALLESNISCFHEGIGVCEQLLGLPIPLSYTRLTSRFLVLWHLTLPIILWDDCHWIVVPATFISAASLFCIEEVGVLIEEPFPMLALDELCRVVQNNIEEAVATEKVIKAQLNVKMKNRSLEHSPNGHPSR